MQDTLEASVNRLGLWSAAVFAATAALSLFLPLDIPDGASAEHIDRVAWLNANRGAFILGWANQMVAMLSLSLVFLGICWHVSKRSMVCASIAGIVVVLSVMAFVVPKFIAIWTLPQLAAEIAAGTRGARIADPLLLLLNVSVPFSLYTSFDYLGFWLYALFALMIAKPLFGRLTSAKVAAVSAGLYGLGFHLLLVLLLAGSLSPAALESGFLGISALLVITVFAMVFTFKQPADRGAN